MDRVKTVKFQTVVSVQVPGSGPKNVLVDLIQKHHPDGSIGLGIEFPKGCIPKGITMTDVLLAYEDGMVK